MPRSAIRVIAFLVLALLGAPVTLHVVLHDLSDHHEAQEHSGVIEAGHGDHEHPIVGSAPPAALRLMRTTLPALPHAPLQPGARIRMVNAERSELSFGALRIDDDVGLQALLATFLI